MLPAASALLMIALSGLPGAAESPMLASAQRLSTNLSRLGASGDEGQRVAAAAELALLVDAVVGDGRAGMAGRDQTAYTLLGLGYSAKETADIVSGRVTKRTLDTAHAMRLVGRGHEAAADHVDRQHRRLNVTLAALADVAVTIPSTQKRVTPALVTAAVRPVAATITTARAAAPRTARVNPATALAEPFEAAIVKYARLHAVDPALIRAIIGAESRFVSGARSSAGAIGLMQLMPATARALGVNPHVADENIEGGVRYVAELLRMFGGVELALVAYNAGPGFAGRYSRGEVSLYGETRQYVSQVLGRLRSAR